MQIRFAGQFYSLPVDKYALIGWEKIQKHIFLSASLY